VNNASFGQSYEMKPNIYSVLQQSQARPRKPFETSGTQADSIEKYHADTDKVNIWKDQAQYRAEREINLSHFQVTF
jgi:hypothetical protein